MKRRRLIVTVSIIVTVCALLFVAYYYVRLTALRDARRYELKGILNDLAFYSNNIGRLPFTVEKDKKGNPLFSWRFANAALILNDHVQTSFYGMYVDWETRWDDPSYARYRDGPYREYY